MFNNCNPHHNGEYRISQLVNSKSNQVIFDVGCRTDTFFESTSSNEVHYFDPNPEYIDTLKRTSKNENAYFNKFGLSDKEEVLSWHPTNECFLLNIPKEHSWGDTERIDLPLRRGHDYVKENNIKRINFLKIDVEGFEFKVLSGFNESLHIVDTIQFEYGGCWRPVEWNNRGTPPTLECTLKYLEKYGFDTFEYIGPHHNMDIGGDRTDHYKYCNILCSKKDTK